MLREMIKIKSTLLPAGIFLIFTFEGFAQSFDHTKFDSLLKKNVTQEGLVNYRAFKNNKQFENYLSNISKANLNNFSKEEKLAFYINSYNACTIKNILNHSPVGSPMDVDGFFKKHKFKVAGEELSLDEIEYDRTLKIEPVLSHFGLVCAAKSCPRLLPAAYTAENIYNQLEENMKLFLRDTSRNHIDKEKNILYVSQIFNWFKDSFEKKYGSLKNLATRGMKNSDANFLRNNEVKISFLEYNWELNSQ
jgi:hypothetical protein